MASTHTQASIILSLADFGDIDFGYNGTSWRTPTNYGDTLLAGTYKFQQKALNGNTDAFQPFAIVDPNPDPNGIQYGTGQAIITNVTGNSAWQPLYGYYPIWVFCYPIIPIRPIPRAVPIVPDFKITFDGGSFEDTGNSDTEKKDGISTDNNFDLSVSSTISGVTYEISNDPIGTADANLQWHGTVANIRNLFDGYYRFRAKSGDKTSTNTITITIDRTGPDFGLIKHGLDQPNDSSGQAKRSSGQEFQNADAFAAILKNGLVKTWGDRGNGGDSSDIDFDGANDNLKVTQIFSTASAFAALRSDGSVLTWGNNSNGGNSTGIDFDGDGNTNTYTGSKKVTQIFSTETAFAALRSDGSVLTWGNNRKGGK